MHDYFEILGVSRDARPNEIRRACCRRSRASHPDVWDGDAVSPLHRAGAPSGDRAQNNRELSDAAIDFIDATVFVDAIRASFFA